MTIDASVALITPSEAFGSLRYLVVLAEDERFELSRPVRVWRFSKPLPSATRPILQYIRPTQIVALRED